MSYVPPASEEGASRSRLLSGAETPGQLLSPASSPSLSLSLSLLCLVLLHYFIFFVVGGYLISHLHLDISLRQLRQGRHTRQVPESKTPPHDRVTTLSLELPPPTQLYWLYSWVKLPANRAIYPPLSTPNLTGLSA
jgi:hypothetical protein